jgi:hypothetical protein
MQVSQTQKSKPARKTMPSKQPPREVAATKAKGRPNSIKPASTSAGQSAPRTTKQELVLTLLSRKEGTSVDDIMKATSWQVHSVRGFFAGTVKKKLGFTLTSSKAKGAKRLYRIEVRGAR